MLYNTDRLTLWLGWIVVASLILTIVPLGPYGLLGWLAAVGPLMHKVAPQIGIRRMALLGLGAIGGVLIFAGVQHWLEVVLPPAVFLFGLLLAPVPIATPSAAGSEASVTTAEEEFQRAMAREVGRARRYERPLTLLSATTNPASLHLLESAITSQVHVYAQLFHVGDRLLVIVPELDADAYPALRQRILEAAGALLLNSIELGAASFPDGECTASGMIEIADANRRHLSLPHEVRGNDDQRKSGNYGLSRP